MTTDHLTDEQLRGLEWRLEADGDVRKLIAAYRAARAERDRLRLIEDVFREGFKAEVVEYHAVLGRVLIHLTYRQYQQLDNALEASDE